MPRVPIYHDPARFARIMVKALIVAVLINSAFLATGLDPATILMTVNTQWLFGHGRPRLYYQEDGANGQLPIEAVLATHEISRPKAPDEFRVVFIGDSSVLAAYVSDDETLAGQLTRLDVHIGGKRVVAYNLGYPSSSILRDALTIDAIMAYQPDLIITFVTLAAFSPTPSPFELPTFTLNEARLKRLTDVYGLQSWFDMAVPVPPQWSKALAFKTQDALPQWMRLLTLGVGAPAKLFSRIAYDKPIVDLAATRTDYEIPAPGYLWQFLMVMQDITQRHGVSLFVINSPIALDVDNRFDPNWDPAVRYYKKYHSDLNRYAHQFGIWYLDLQDYLLPARFLDTMFHYDSLGIRNVFKRLLASLTDKYGPDNISIPPLPEPERIDKVAVSFSQPVDGLGWGGTEGNFTWMVSDEASLEFRLKEQQDYRITFQTLNSITPDIRDSLTLLVNDQAINLKRTGPNNALLYTGVIPRTAIARDPDLTHLAFRTNRALSPSSLGLGNDDRQLAVQFAWLRIEPIQPTRSIYFQFNTPFPNNGWAQPEGDSAKYQWMQASEAVVDFTLTPTSDYHIQFRIVNAITPKVLNSLELFINDTPIPLQRRANESGAYLFSGTLPQSVIDRSNGDTRFVFHVAQVISPESLGINGDARTLGVAFEWLRIEPLNVF